MLLDKLGLDKLPFDRFSKEDLEETLIGSTPLLAVVGAGDFAVERLRAARAELAARSASFDPMTIREQAQATLADGLEALQSELMSAPEQLMALPERAQEWPTRAQSMFADVVSAAFSTYGELAGRGKALVTARMLAADDVDEALADDVLPVTRPGTSNGTSTGTPVVKPVTRTASPAAEAGFAPATPQSGVDAGIEPEPVPESVPPLVTRPAPKPRRKAAATPATPAKVAARKKAAAKKTTGAPGGPDATPKGTLG